MIKQLLFTFLMHSPALATELIVYQSETMPREGFLFIDDCFVSIKTDKIHDMCHIKKLLKKQCNIFYFRPGDCNEK